MTGTKQGASTCPVTLVAAGDLEREVQNCLRQLLLTPSILAATSVAAINTASCEGMRLDHQRMLDAMHDLDGLWDELVPAEQQRIVEVMAGRLDIGLGRCDLHLRKGGIGNLANAVRGTNEITVQEDETIVRLPLRARLRSGRTMVVAAPQPETRPTGSTRTDPLLLACARAFRWQDDLESGRVRSVSSLAEREQVDEAYVRRHLRLALVDPAIRDPHRSREWRWRYGQHQANDRRKRHDRCVGKAAA